MILKTQLSSNILEHRKLSQINLAMIFYLKETTNDQSTWFERVENIQNVKRSHLNTRVILLLTRNRTNFYLILISQNENVN